LINSSPFDYDRPSSGILEWESLDSTKFLPSTSALAELSAHDDTDDDPEDVNTGWLDPSGLRDCIPLELNLNTAEIESHLQLLLSEHEEAQSIERDLAELAQFDPRSSSQHLIHELSSARERLVDSQAELRSIQQYNKSQVDNLEHHVLEAKQIEFRIQKIARHSKNQLAKVQDLLVSIERVRQEIISGLDNFGGYEQIQGMLGQLEETRYSLVIAHDRLKTGQEAFYESLQAIKDDSAARSAESEQKLQAYHQSIDGLMKSLEEDRQQIVAMAIDIARQVTEISELKSQIAVMHGQMEEKSHTLHGKIKDITEGFTELSTSVQTEKEQFYQLTAETIDKAEGMRAQFAEIAKQITHDRSIVEDLKTDIESVQTMLNNESIQELNLFAQRSKEMMSTWLDIQARQKSLALRYRKISMWLWMLTFGMGVLIVLLVAIFLRIN
jgi:chromosome segregation ATPase